MSKAAVKTKEKHPFYSVGKAYFIRTATYHQVGLLTAMTETELILTRASWIADSGRFTQAIADGTYSEVEPWPAPSAVLVNRAAVIDAVQIPTDHLPRDQK